MQTSLFWCGNVDASSFYVFILLIVPFIIQTCETRFTIDARVMEAKYTCSGVGQRFFDFARTFDPNKLIVPEENQLIGCKEYEKSYLELFFGISFEECDSAGWCGWSSYLRARGVFGSVASSQTKRDHCLHLIELVANTYVSLAKDDNDSHSDDDIFSDFANKLIQRDVAHAHNVHINVESLRQNFCAEVREWYKIEVLGFSPVPFDQQTGSRRHAIEVDIKKFQAEHEILATYNWDESARTMTVAPLEC